MGAEAKVSVAEIVKHASTEDCWVVVNGKVYDLSRFASEHPGGPQGMLTIFRPSTASLT